MTKETNISQKEGFTIIEVVLVLAIAGLIFLMVFVALPALQRSQRDTQRRNDIARVSTSLTNYQTNHSYSDKTTNLPEVDVVTQVGWAGTENFKNGAEGEAQNACSNIACEFVRDYMNSGVESDSQKQNTFNDPSGNPYSLVISKNVAVDNKGLVALESPEDAGGKEEGAEKFEVTGTGASEEGTLSSGQAAFETYTIFMIPGARCDGDKAKVASKNNYAILYRLEGAGVYCIDDQ